MRKTYYVTNYSSAAAAAIKAICQCKENLKIKDRKSEIGNRRPEIGDLEIQNWLKIKNWAVHPTFFKEYVVKIAENKALYRIIA